MNISNEQSKKLKNLEVKINNLKRQKKIVKKINNNT